MPLLDELREAVVARDEANGVERQHVEPGPGDVLPEFRRPELLAPYRRCWVGPRSLVAWERRRRLRRIVDDFTAGELARAYLRLAYPERAVPRSRVAAAFGDRNSAYFFAGGVQVGRWALVDVDACYASIYSRLTLDVVYRPECDPPYLALGRYGFPRRDEWLALKKERNALAGSLKRRYLPEWRFGKRCEASPNRWYAPDLWGAVLDIAHSVAAETREQFGSVSWSVDAGCVWGEAA